jgi:hypothetical protein
MLQPVDTGGQILGDDAFQIQRGPPLAGLRWIGGHTAPVQVGQQHRVAHIGQVLRGVVPPFLTSSR